MYDTHRSASASSEASTSHGHAGKRTLTGQLPPRLAARASASLGHDFSTVTVHQDGSAEALGTQAYARGDALHFAAGAYRPDTAEGAAMIGHELGHVAQQRAGRVAATELRGTTPVNTDAALERDADAAGAAVAQGFDLDEFSAFGALPAASAGAGVVQGLDLAPTGTPATSTPGSAATSTPGAAPAAAPGAATAGKVPPAVLDRRGARFRHADDASAARDYLILPDGGFELVASSTGRGVGATFRPTDTGAKGSAWEVLAAYVVAHAAEIPPTVAPVEPPAETAPAEDDPWTFGGLLQGAADLVTGAIDAGLALFGDVTAIIDAALDAIFGAEPDDGATPAPGEPGVTPGDPGGTPGEPTPGEPTPGEPTTPGSADVPAMSQFRWYSFAGTPLGVDAVFAAAQLISSTFGFGGTVEKVTEPTDAVKSKNGNSGYYWFDANGAPTSSGKTGGTQYVTFTIKDGETSAKLNPVSAYLADHAPGERPAEVTLGGKAVAVPDGVRQLDLRNIPGMYSCFATSQSMMAAAGVHAVGSGHEAMRDLITSETYRDYTDDERASFTNADGSIDQKKQGKIRRDITAVTMDADKAAMAKAYLDFETAAGRPVFTGITYSDRNCNTDGETDHWVVVTGGSGSGSYTFNDPGDGSSGKEFVWDGEKFNYARKPPYLYVISWIRPNVESLAAWEAHWAERQAGGASGDGAAPTAGA